MLFKTCFVFNYLFWNHLLNNGQDPGSVANFCPPFIKQVPNTHVLGVPLNNLIICCASLTHFLPHFFCWQALCVSNAKAMCGVKSTNHRFMCFAFQGEMTGPTARSTVECCNQ